MTANLSKHTGHAIFLIRVMIGIIFLASGAQKLFGVFDGPGIDKTVLMMEKLEFAVPAFLGYAYCMVEFFGGVFLIFGLFPRTISFLQIVFLGLMIWKLHAPNGFFSENGLQYPLLLTICCIAIFLTGPGSFASYDRY